MSEAVENQIQAQLELVGPMQFRAVAENQTSVTFDATREHGGSETAPTPMQTFLYSVAACSAMDVVSILEKKRKTVSRLSIDISSTRADEHPRVYTSVHLVYNLESPDATLEDLNRSIVLSQDKYCSASAMFKAAGCQVTWDSKLV